MDSQVTLICKAADKAAAEELASQFPGGAGTFSIPLCTEPNVTDLAQVTHWAGSGWMPEEMAAAFDVNVDPMFKVFPFTDAAPDFLTQIAACTPQLYRLYPDEPV